jgi:HSP20 family protein
MATMVRWAPLSELAQLHNEMSRFMNGLLDGNGRTSQSWVPVADVWETEQEVVYALDLPGIPEDKISVELDDSTLTVTAERERKQQVEDGRYYRFERRFGTFSRAIALPQGVTEEHVRAVYENGVLELHVAKPEQPKPRKIQIGLGGTEQPTIEGSAERKA